MHDESVVESRLGGYLDSRLSNKIHIVVEQRSDLGLAALQHEHVVLFRDEEAPGGGEAVGEDLGTKLGIIGGGGVGEGLRAGYSSGSGGNHEEQEQQLGGRHARLGGRG